MRQHKIPRLNGTQATLLGFLAVILLGSGLLALPVSAADGHAESMNRQELNQCPFNFRYMLSQALVPITISQDVD